MVPSIPRRLPIAFGIAFGRRLAVLALASLASNGCAREIAAGLDESEANRGVVSLARVGIASEKRVDPTADGKFQLVVPHDEATAAIAVLASEEIPRPKFAAARESSLIASPDADRASQILSTATQLAQTLRAIDGVLDARVHLDVPVVDPLSTLIAPAAGEASAGPGARRATASVLVRHRGVNPPIAADEIRKLIAGGVSGLTASDVAVVLVAVPAPSLAADRAIGRLGPLAIVQTSMATARSIAFGLIAAIAILGGVVVVLATRLRAMRNARVVLGSGAAPRNP